MKQSVGKLEGTLMLVKVKLQTIKMNNKMASNLGVMKL